MIDIELLCPGPGRPVPRQGRTVGSWYGLDHQTGLVRLFWGKADRFALLEPLRGTDNKSIRYSPQKAMDFQSQLTIFQIFNMTILLSSI